jgi:superfamily II RNA helicase
MSSDYVRVVTDTEPVPAAPASPALVTGYEPDRFQKFAIEAIEAGENVLCLAKTGSGKTFVGEYQIAKSLQRGGRIFYTTPIKSLSNQKFHDLKKLFPEASVGIMTGDIKFRPDAQIIVMTTEILRNLLFKRGTATEKVGATALVSLDGLDAVVFDEVHYINDPDRGHVWEETLILLPPAVKLILLSATLSSPFGFAKWLGESKKVRIWLISTLWRAVPLEHCVFVDGKPQVIYDSKEQFHDGVYRNWREGKGAALLAHDKFKDKVHQMKSAGFQGGVAGKVRPKAFEHQLNECLEYLDSHAALPAIFFVFSRVGCEKLADKITGTFLDTSDAAAVAHIWDFHLSRFKDSLEKSPQYHRLRELAMRGIAFHHSGLLPFLKEILEVLFSKGLVKVLMATETFAVGINMPTKTVVFTAVEKFTDNSIRLLRSAEYIQMAGRAGRRGKDDRGLVIYLPQREPAELYEVRQLMTGRAATFGSRMNFHYNFVLKAASQNNDASLEKTLVEDSYWWQLLKEDIEANNKEISAAAAVADQRRALLTDAEVAACEVKEEIEHRVATLQNAKRKAAQRELDSWHGEHKGSQWAPVLVRYTAWLGACEEMRISENRLASLLREKTVPQIQMRQQVLAEYGYVDEAFRASAKGLLASEVNEGHPFLMTELFLRLEGKSAPWLLSDLLTILAVFLGEGRTRSDDVDHNKHPSDLGVGPAVRDELLRILGDARAGHAREEAMGLPDDLDYWTVSTEWVEAVAYWLGPEGTAKPILPSVAAEFGVFEGNLQKALMKLMGLVEEFRALATLSNDVGWLEKLEGAQAIVLRDVVVAESLYLRI